MKFLTTGLTAILGLALLSVTGCGSSPEALCNDSAHALCDKAFECTAAADQSDAWKAIFGADADACFTMWSGSGAMDCANQTNDTACDSATPNYDSGKANDCLKAMKDQTCDDYTAGTGLDVCQEVCTA